MRFPRATGILLHPTWLRGPNGIGEIGPDAFGFADWFAEAGQRTWQVLPLGPTGYGDSPYQCFSAFAGNPLIFSLDRGYFSQQDIARRPKFPQAHVDNGAVMQWKFPFPAKAAKAFFRHASTGTPIGLMILHPRRASSGPGCASARTRRSAPPSPLRCPRWRRASDAGAFPHSVSFPARSGCSPLS